MEEAGAAHAGRIRRQARRRAIADMLAVTALVPALAVLGDSTHESLLWGFGALSLGMLFIVIRRGRDAMAIARADHWRAEAVAGRGIGLAEWQDGQQLASWEARRILPTAEAERSRTRRQDVPCEP